MTRTERNESKPLLEYSALEFRFHLVGNLAPRVTPLFRAMGYSTTSPELGTTARRTPSSTSTELTLEGTQPDGPYELLIDGDSIFRTVDLGALVHQAVWEITRRGVASSNQPIVLHAGAVVLKETTVLISGPSGSGKSTLTLPDRRSSRDQPVRKGLWFDWAPNSPKSRVARDTQPGRSKPRCRHAWRRRVSDDKCA